jgi:hypothetical protein
VTREELIRAKLAEIESSYKKPQPNTANYERYKRAIDLIIYGLELLSRYHQEDASEPHEKNGRV